MNVAEVIESLVEEKGLDRDKVVEIVCNGVQLAYERRHPGIQFVVKLNKRTTAVDVFAKKQVVSSVANADLEISLRKARTVKMSAQVGDEVEAPFEEPIGRIEVAAARQHIATQIRDLEQSAIYDEFRDKEGSIVSGTIHKK
ncbi:hypothetical protein HOD08_03425, partial [bacterium]|nr:hypothetical protein [bacterium]